ncbi:hypothetical protein NQ315_013919 [Exocentrus adspersus]|uniref:Uncharacterized protein n=1 Tax=Exocentrus adspersus TaxID=1586481 RepID=A0AAV8VS56_9CUCU|nr:hypothetical protein NQ315_013919 [Exocentrus adspersus]
MGDSSKTFADKRLSITREAELLQSFVRINVHAVEKHEGEEIGQAEDKTLEMKKEGDISGNGQTPISPGTTKKLSEQLTQELRKKTKNRRARKKNGSRNEEIYCDKDRAAAVNMGSKDIKQSLKLKRKEDRSKYLQIPEEAEPSTFLALGNYEMCRGDLQIAVDFMSKVILFVLLV